MLSDIVQNILLHVFASPSFAHEVRFWSWMNDEIDKIWDKKYTGPTFESSRFESCSHYEKEIVKHFNGEPVASWAMTAWNCKKHRSPERFWPSFTRKWFRRNKHATFGLRVTLQYHSYPDVPIRLSPCDLHLTEMRRASPPFWAKLEFS